LRADAPTLKRGLDEQLLEKERVPVDGCLQPADGGALARDNASLGGAPAVAEARDVIRPSISLEMLGVGEGWLAEPEPPKGSKAGGR
jgi:hypothetical protein